MNNMLCFKNNRKNKVCKIDILFGYCQRSSFFLSSRSVVTLISERREVLLGFEWLSFKKLICVPFCLFQDAAPHFKLSKPTKWHCQVLLGYHQESLHFVDSLLVNRHISYICFLAVVRNVHCFFYMGLVGHSKFNLI